MNKNTEANIDLTLVNEIKILTSFYRELKHQGFSFTVYDGELYNEIETLDQILAFHSDLDEMSIHVERDNLKMVAKFIFGNGEDGIYCMYDYSCSLENLISETSALIEKLAKERQKRLERMRGLNNA